MFSFGSLAIPPIFPFTVAVPWLGFPLVVYVSSGIWEKINYNLKKPFLIYIASELHRISHIILTISGEIDWKKHKWIKIDLLKYACVVEIF